MSKARDKEKELLARLAEEELRRQGLDHPPAERLTAYRAGTLPDHEANVLREHLALCPECTRGLLALPRFSREAEERIDRPRVPEPLKPLLELLKLRPAALPVLVPVERRFRNDGPPDSIERRRHFIPVPIALY